MKEIESMTTLKTLVSRLESGNYHAAAQVDLSTAESPCQLTLTIASVLMELLEGKAILYDEIRRLRKILVDLERPKAERLVKAVSVFPNAFTEADIGEVAYSLANYNVETATNTIKKIDDMHSHRSLESCLNDE